MNQNLDVVQSVHGIVNSVPRLIDAGIREQNDREAYFLAQEEWIRKRVALLDEADSLIIKERQMLELQHEHCREQIRKARETKHSLCESHERFKEACSVSPSLQKQEIFLDEQLNSVSSALDLIEQELKEANQRKESSERVHAELKEEEKKKSDSTMELLDDVEELLGRQRSLSTDIKKLEQQRDTLSKWSALLDKKGVILASRKNDLYRRHAMDKAYHNPDHFIALPFHKLLEEPMTIDHDAECEEISV